MNEDELTKQSEELEGWEVFEEPDFCPFDQLYWVQVRKDSGTRLLGRSVFLIKTVAFPANCVENNSLPAPGDVITLTSITH